MLFLQQQVHGFDIYWHLNCNLHKIKPSISEGGKSNNRNTLKKQADVCKTFTSRPFRIPGTPAPNYKNWDKRRTVNSKILLGLGWATGGRSMFYKHLFLYLLNMLNLKNVIL